MLGVWMWPQSVRVHGAEKTVSWCARCGVTDIYFLTKGLSGEVSYQSELAPHPDRDLLQELLDAAQTIFRPENLCISVERDPNAVTEDMDQLFHELRSML